LGKTCYLHVLAALEPVLFLFLRVDVCIVEVAAARVQAANHRRRWRGLQKASMFELNSHSGQ
jgi:hypothetical protein